jgi:REP element-mobilizing transposase RayT
MPRTRFGRFSRVHDCRKVQWSAATRQLTLPVRRVDGCRKVQWNASTRQLTLPVRRVGKVQWNAATRQLTLPVRRVGKVQWNAATRQLTLPVRRVEGAAPACIGEPAASAAGWKGQPPACFGEPAASAAGWEGDMERYWFYSWRTYGTWLPGEDGFVGYHHRNTDGQRAIDNVPGQPPTEAIPALERYARETMRNDMVLLNRKQAQALLAQFHETASYRHWVIDAVAVMVNHVHIVFGVMGDPDPSGMLRDWKSYASRALNRAGPRPRDGRWWADQGSKRPIRTDERRLAALKYVRDQEAPLLVWLSAEARQLLGEPATPNPAAPPPGG